MNEKLLMEINNNVELFLYEGILKKNEIPYIIKRKNMGGYMKILAGAASHSTPADIYVNENDYEKAMEITAVIRTEANGAPDNKENPSYKKKYIFAWAILGMFVLMIIVALISNLTP